MKNKTQFITPIRLASLLKEIEEGNKIANKAVINEYDRLSNRIKELESGIQNLIPWYESSDNKNPDGHLFYQLNEQTQTK